MRNREETETTKYTTGKRQTTKNRELTKRNYNNGEEAKTARKRK